MDAGTVVAGAPEDRSAYVFDLPAGALIITQPPEGREGFGGETVGSSVLVGGSQPLGYQWRRDGVQLVDDDRVSGSTTDTLTIDLIEPGDARVYDVVVTNPCGSLASAGAELVVHLRGDLNCDGSVDYDDIDSFVLALSSQEAYEAELPDCNWLNADCDGDGDVDYDDIDPFVLLLSGG